ncbi:hypothetical protein A2673_00305 [Candidatus Kaiserbacteria bacterium RIFCSPHIGHO2_01_FULL_50_13]|uniref:DoxX family protein n=1 Tax=Candidatus Kaiserbacteria bacterium RIFCSPLOWO2_01_FULL_50_24 TaxID=1798507 RepID=A0A1F6EIZ8_9BACT|nr:MAG: hypothetical protein A2673_00305 [Candidatus Kaiserbacteria bacterium RIFCSPHIGHO2_01_FULL_50_13]OGG73623.1 MAG: hypothetical protein A3A34_03025 [Candidatus Kaiserbacteria bacterium RIFCSPLOWO2_01_FULL_50_24]OGG81285.1 MAG: hypothetical protein A3H74_03895 [Candidatus Kaiserbacteria bacterium RIFCSPLOWO2_02_FULL_51_13]
MNNSKIIEGVLRIAVSAEFIGHGVFAYQGKEEWLAWFPHFGITNMDIALQLMALVGIMDIALGILILVRPVRILILWMALWAVWAALVRPIVGDPIWDFVERGANWGAPLALFLLYGWPRSFKEWFYK